MGAMAPIKFENDLIVPMMDFCQKCNLHPLIEISKNLLGILQHPSIEIPNDAPVVCLQKEDPSSVGGTARF